MTLSAKSPVKRRPGRKTFARPHWSYSQLSQFQRCPLRYFFQYMARLPLTSTPGTLALGSAVHEGLAEYHTILQAGEAATTEHAITAFQDSWKRSEGERPIQFRSGERRETVIDLGVALLEKYCNEPPPENIVAVEEAMIVPLCTSDGHILEKPLVAVVDLLTHEENGLVINEFKTSGRKVSENEVATAAQASCYAHVIRERYDQSASVRYTVLVKTKTPYVQRIETTRSESDLTRLGDTFLAVEQAIDAKAYYPIESPMNCTSCAYREPCREWQGKATTTHLIQLNAESEAA